MLAGIFFFYNIAHTLYNPLSLVTVMALEGSDSFYCYVNSRDCLNEYPLNRANAFTNTVSPSLNLIEQYEASLVNILLPHSFIAIKGGDPKFYIRFRIRFYDPTAKKGDEAYKIIQAYTVKYIPTHDLISNNIHDLVDKLNADLLHFLISSRVVGSNHGFILRYGEHDAYTRMPKLEVLNSVGGDVHQGVQFSDAFQQLLGVTENAFLEKPKMPRAVEYIMVYADIINPSYIGSQSVHLLDIIPTSALYSKTGILSTYKTVSTQCIGSISLRLTDQDGQSIPFPEQASVLAIIHFRRTS